MSIITRCPQCHTHFKVVPDQLKVSEGWARCGNCNYVFDAIANQSSADSLATNASQSNQTPHQTSISNGSHTSSDTTETKKRSASIPSSANTFNSGGVAQSEDVVSSAPFANSQPTSAATDSTFDFITSIDKSFSASTFHPASHENLTAEYVSNRQFQAPKTESVEDFAHNLVQAKQQSPTVNDVENTAADLKSLIEQLKPKQQAQIAENKVERAAKSPTTVQQSAPATVPRDNPTSLNESQPDDSYSLADYHDTSTFAGYEERSSQAQSSNLEHEKELLHMVGNELGNGGIYQESRPEFVLAAERAARWNAAPVKVALWLSCVIFALTLLTQLALWQRHYLALAAPGAKPFLNQLCAFSGCKILPWRQIDSMLIDASSFNRVRGNDYRFTVTLRNTANFPVATPHVLLTLTDEDNQPVLKRVFTPLELSLPSNNVPVENETAGSALVEIRDMALASSVTGYKAMVFYP